MDTALLEKKIEEGLPLLDGERAYQKLLILVLLYIAKAIMSVRSEFDEANTSLRRL